MIQLSARTATEINEGREMMMRRLLQLYAGLILYGISAAMYVRADLGADPWNVFHLGIARIFSLDLGIVMIITGAVVLLLWIPLRTRPGIGTLSNVIVLGLAADAALTIIPPMEALSLRIPLLVAALVVNGLATGMYIGAGLGAGPRDGLMTGIHARTGWSIRSIRTTIEVTVLSVGWLMGGAFGAGTVLYALAIGPLIQIFLPWFHIAPKQKTTSETMEAVVK